MILNLRKLLLSLADLFVNDAFGAAHRAHASTEGIAHFIPAVSGLLMEKELDVLGKALNQPRASFHSNRWRIQSKRQNQLSLKIF